MMNKMKRFVSCALVAGLVLVAGVVPVKASPAEAPSYAGGIRFQTPAFLGIKVARVMNTATITRVIAGQGLLYAICPSGGTAGKYTVAFDSLVATGLSLTALMSDNGNPSAYLISPLVFTRWGSGGISNEIAQSECFVPPYPIRFEAGLNIANSDTGHRTVILYRLDSDVNP